MITNLQSDLQNSQEQNQDVKKQLFDCQRQVAEYKTTIQSMKLQNEEQLQLLSELRDERKILKEQIETIEQQHVVERLAIESSATAQMETMRMKHQEEQSVNFTLDQQQKEDLRKLEHTNRQLTQRLEKAQNELAVLTTTHKSAIDSSANQRTELLNENQELKANLVTQIRSLNQLELRHKEVATSHRKLLDQITQLETRNSELEHAERELLVTKTHLDQLQIEFRRLQTTMESITEVNETLSNELAEAKSDRDRRAQEFEEIVRAVREIHALLRPGDEQPQEIGPFLKELTILRTLLSDAHSEIEELIGQRDQLTREVAELQNAESRLAKADERTKAKLGTAKSRAEALEMEVTALREAQEKYAIERQKLNAAISRLRGALNLTKESLAASEQEKVQLKEQKLQLRLLVEQVRDLHSLEIAIPADS
jgi:chromosome segregation ATPase